VRLVIKNKPDFDLIDKTVRRLRFFKNFAQNIRMKLYQVGKYDIIPAGRIIAHQEEFESHIYVLISGIASLTVKYLDTNESYSGMLIYPGDAIGDANIKDKIVISKGRGETKVYISSTKECDILVFDRKTFTDVLFKDMMDSLYEKILCMRNSEFFQNLSPYAMVILCSNIELQEYCYGDVILRQETEPEECFIIVQGECKLVLETVIYKAIE
jgi:CRP-like cAMP-binding protein